MRPARAEVAHRGRSCVNHLAEENVSMFDFSSFFEAFLSLFQDFFTVLQDLLGGLFGGVLPGL